MSQSKEYIEPIKPPIRNNKNFVYKGKKYPIDFSLIKKYSTFFYNSRNSFKYVDDIELKAGNYEINEEAIPMFIACCQNEPFEITDSNVFSLYQLSVQYEVPELTSITNKYISKNQENLIFQSIQIKLQNLQSMPNADLSEDEEIIATNFFKYINDDQLMALPIPVLYRILNNDHLQLNSLSQTNQTQLIEFLFKCLDKYKREASVLFLNLDLEYERKDVLSRLLRDYQNTFDFCMINPKCLAKSASMMMSEMERLKIEYSNKYTEIVNENEKQKNDFEASKNDLLNSNRLLEKKLKNLEKRQEEQESDFESYKSEVTEKMQKQQSRMKEMEEKIEQQTQILDRFANAKVEDIQIISEPDSIQQGSNVKLTAFVKPQFAFNDGVKWSIKQEIEGSVTIQSQNEKFLVLNVVNIKGKITVVATALDGSGVQATKELEVAKVKATIDASVQSDQIIKGEIRVIEKEGGSKLDMEKSKFLLNRNSSSSLGKGEYKSGLVIDKLVKKICFLKPQGTYYVHALIVDNYGRSEELISTSLATKGAQLDFDYTGDVQQVTLDPGSYKLEAWGAQGGSYNSTYYGGYGGYSTGSINIESKTTLYIVVGQSSNSTVGGYNGGGCGGQYKSGNQTMSSYSGGGASHVGLKPGLLTTFSNDYSSNLLIAAGGGGGAVEKTAFDGNCSIGGCGGGCCGAEGQCSQSSNRIGKGATQNSGGIGGTHSNWSVSGEFGRGGDCKNPIKFYAGGGGGGGFYGGGSGGNSGPGGGGSGYINTSKLSDAVMFGHGVKSSSSLESKTISTSNVSSAPTSQYAKQGNGFVRITLL